MAPEIQPSGKARIEPLFDEAALRESVSEMGRKLAADFDGSDGSDEPLLLAILGGSVIFLADLVRAIQRPVLFELMQVGYSAGGEAAGAAGEMKAAGAAGELKAAAAAGEVKAAGAADTVQNIHYPIPVEIAGRRVVVLKDVVSSGVIEVYLGEQVRQHGAREVRFAALIDLLDERKTDFELDYRAFTTRRKGVFVGYGLKHEGRYGNLPYIGRLPETA
ncbi:MAG TPA: phosphoribosyltransferase family protein [Thermoanaerobaculia bacterium]|nr:phosphoribosyltransferase family protein [Thermoanaerobaculia bacterium]